MVKGAMANFPHHTIITSLWTCVDIPLSSASKEVLPSVTTTTSAKTIHQDESDDNSYMSMSSKSALTDVTPIDYDATHNLPATEYHTIYGPGELEFYRHAQLLQTVKDAKLKVWYPGSWMHHSPRAYFRSRIGGTNATNIRDVNGNERDEIVVLKFRSNARIVSANYISIECKVDGSKNNETATSSTESSHPAAIFGCNGISLRWKSSSIDSNCSMGVVHDHVILAPVMEGRSPINDHHGFLNTKQLDGELPDPFIILELDTRQSTDTKQCIDDDAILNMTAVIENSPPCITLESHHRLQQNWEWTVSLDEDWVAINSFWRVQQSETVEHSNDSGKRTTNAVWHFPHQMELCQVTTVIPVHEMTDIGIVNNENERIYDFGKELIGKVQISLITGEVTSARNHPPKVLLRVGETLEEAMNDHEEYFEQCVDVCSGAAVEHAMAGERFGHPSNTISPNDGCISLNPSQDYISCHLLAFRYVRVIVSDCDGHVNIRIACKVHSPLLQQRGAFFCSDESSSAEISDNPNQDTKIWQTAAYTLQLCIHHNFIIDGKHELDSNC